MVQLPGAPPAPGGGASPGPGGGAVVCRFNELSATLECASSSLPTRPPGAGGAVPARPAPDVAVVPARPAEVDTVLVAQPPAPALQWQPISSNRYRPAPEVTGAPAARLPEQGLYAMAGALSQSRMVSWGGRDYLEMTVSW